MKAANVKSQTKILLLFIGLVAIVHVLTSCGVTVEPLVNKDFDWNQIEKICVVGISDLDRSEEISKILTHAIFEMGFPVSQKKAKTVLDLYDVGREAKADVMIYGYIKKIKTSTRRTVNGQKKTKKIEMCLQLVEADTHNCIWKGMGIIVEDDDVKDAYVIEELLETMMADIIPIDQRRPYAYGRVPMLKVDDKAPQFKVRDVDGNIFSLKKELEEHIVVAGFWYLLCKPCRGTMDVLSSIQRRYESKNVSVIAISIEDRPIVSRIKSYIRDEGHEFTFLLDAPTRDGYAIADPYKVAGVPAAYVIGKSGDIVFARLGSVTFGELVEVIESELARSREGDGITDEASEGHDKLHLDTPPPSSFLP
jgi:peroxiredoxin